MKTDKLNPLDVFKRAIFWISSLSSRMYPNRPGAVIERMSEKERAALRELSSSEVQNQLLDKWDKYVLGGDTFYEKQERLKEKLEFDKKILK